MLFQTAQQPIDRHPVELCQRFELQWVQPPLAPFDLGDERLGFAQCLGDPDLSEPFRQPRLAQPGEEGLVVRRVNAFHMVYPKLGYGISHFRIFRMRHTYPS